MEAGPCRATLCLRPQLDHPEPKQCHRLEVGDGGRRWRWKEDAKLFSPSVVGRALREQGTQAAVGGGAASTPSYPFPQLVPRVAAAQVRADSRAGTP